jgi:hypothetical protein
MTYKCRKMGIARIQHVIIKFSFTSRVCFVRKPFLDLFIETKPQRRYCRDAYLLLGGEKKHLLTHLTVYRSAPKKSTQVHMILHEITNY